jgi:hypothetical protein
MTTYNSGIANESISIIDDILTIVDNLKEKITSFEYLLLTSKLQSLYQLLSNDNITDNITDNTPQIEFTYTPSNNMIWRDNPAYEM